MYKVRTRFKNKDRWFRPRNWPRKLSHRSRKLFQILDQSWSNLLTRTVWVSNADQWTRPAQPNRINRLPARPSLNCFSLFLSISSRQIAALIFTLFIIVNASYPKANSPAYYGYDFWPICNLYNNLYKLHTIAIFATFVTCVLIWPFAVDRLPNCVSSPGSLLTTNRPRKRPIT